MTAPRIAPVHEALSSRLPEGWRAAEDRAFVVVSGGEFAGQRWDAGDVLVLGEGPVVGEAVVLVARGYGRPRLGSVEGRSLRGDAGEACSADRWRVAGRIETVIRAPRSAQVVAIPVRATRDQLPLFDRRAA